MTLHAEHPDAAPRETTDGAGLDAAGLGDVIDAYNQLTDRLQRSYDRLSHEVVRLRGELASTNAQLHRAKRLSALGEMAAGIAHEVRNPLAAIQLYARMIGDDLAAGRTGSPGQHARKIVDAVRGLDGIVNDVLTFARGIEPRFAPTDLAELLAQAVERHRPELERAAVTVDLPRPTPGSAASAAAAHHPTHPVADADPHLLGRALLNLIRNAVDAMTAQPVRRLALDATVVDGVAQITVADTGPGIDDDAVDRIFNPFFTTRHTGTGLGLAIVHRILDAHRGGIAVHNDPATGGAVFTLTFPARADEPVRSIAQRPDHSIAESAGALAA